MPNCPVARLSVCPPPARPAPGPSSFSSLVVPPPPVHSVGDVGPLGCDEGRSVDGGGHVSSGVSAHVDFRCDGVWPRFPPGVHLVRPLFADASVARPVSSVFSSSAKVHSVGRCSARLFSIAPCDCRGRQCHASTGDASEVTMGPPVPTTLGKGTKPTLVRRGKRGPGNKLLLSSLKRGTTPSSPSLDANFMGADARQSEEPKWLLPVLTNLRSSHAPIRPRSFTVTWRCKTTLPDGRTTRQLGPTDATTTAAPPRKALPESF